MNYAKLAGLLAFVLLSCYGTWYATSDHYQKIIAEKQVQADLAVQKQLEINQQLLADKLAQHNAAEAKHAKDQLVINSLANQLAGVHIHIPSCGSVPAGGQTGSSADGEAGVFPTAVDDLFGELQARVSTLVLRCDQINNDAIRLNNEIGAK